MVHTHFASHGSNTFCFTWFIHTICLIWSIHSLLHMNRKYFASHGSDTFYSTWFRHILLHMVQTHFTPHGLVLFCFTWFIHIFTSHGSYDDRSEFYILHSVGFLMRIILYVCIQWNLVTTTAFVLKNIAIKMNFLLYRIFNDQIDMYKKSCFVLISS